MKEATLTEILHAYYDLIKEIIDDVKESQVEITVRFYPDGEIDVEASPYRPITYNCPFNNRINNTEDDDRR